MIRAGRSDKYGQVHVERVGHTGFSDVDEPVALLRAQDEHALPTMHEYLWRLLGDERVSVEQIASVNRQIAAFEAWHRWHPEKVRTPGSKTSEAS